MKIAILGSGGREHALAVSISKSSKIEKIYCIPGNAGTSEIATNINLDINDFDNLYNFLNENKIDLVVVGPEQPLVNGIVDYLEKFNIKVFGPNKIASQLEGSKIFTKKLCEKYKIPTAKFGIFENLKKAYDFIETAKFPLVVKADGLASGKGVYICANKKNAQDSVKEVFDGKFGEAKNILIEEFLSGEEMSYFIISDGKTYKKFQTAQDHKRALEGDKGLNTGGMGAYSPSRLINDKLDSKIVNKIIIPTLKGIKDLDSYYKGFLYVGLMIVDNEPFLIEYNVRMGDPECQTILPRLKTDLFKIIEACCEEKLSEIKVEWHKKKSLSIVLCSNGYPERYENHKKINNLEKLKLTKNEYLFHAGTTQKNNEFFSNGGRVLNFVIVSDSFKDSRERSIKLIQKLNWTSGFFRRDIGYKVIN